MILHEAAKRLLTQQRMRDEDARQNVAIYVDRRAVMYGGAESGYKTNIELEAKIEPLGME